jgi:hypothetical protein
MLGAKLYYWKPCRKTLNMSVALSEMSHKGPIQDGWGEGTVNCFLTPIHSKLTGKEVAT